MALEKAFRRRRYRRDYPLLVPNYVPSWTFETWAQPLCLLNSPWWKESELCRQKIMAEETFASRDAIASSDNLHYPKALNSSSVEIGQNTNE